MTLAGTPTAIALSGISQTTTAPAPIMTLFPMVTFPIIIAPGLITTLLPIVGNPSLGPFTTIPIVTP